MSLTVQQLLSDAKRLSSRLRDHDQSADHLISRAQEVLKEVDAMRQYQEDVENLNEVAHNRPRAQLVLGIQQENRHIRTLQQENKELRAALEEHQNALELIMSKYRQHVTRLVNAPHPDCNNINSHKIQVRVGCCIFADLSSVFAADLLCRPLLLMSRIPFYPFQLLLTHVSRDLQSKELDVVVVLVTDPHQSPC